jgi:predicted NAD-dependent protein-ADP-ribosyltransferase YbiA (DUF1768 family)
MTTTDTDSTPLFFWREFEEPYGFLSQWYDSPFVVEGVTYASTEMWMMIQKAKLFGDEVGYLPTMSHYLQTNLDAADSTDHLPSSRKPPKR